MVVVVVDELVEEEGVDVVLLDEVVVVPAIVVVVTLPALYLSICVIDSWFGRSTFEPDGTNEAVMIEPPRTWARAGFTYVVGIKDA